MQSQSVLLEGVPSCTLAYSSRLLQWLCKITPKDDTTVKDFDAGLEGKRGEGRGGNLLHDHCHIMFMMCAQDLEAASSTVDRHTIMMKANMMSFYFTFSSAFAS